MRVKQEKIDRIKEIQLEMLKEVDAFCRKNDIKYCLAYGTLLGAIRHNGYIPWDDDVDIWMPREDYEIFLRTFQSLDNTICNIGNTEGYPFYMSKIINKRTRLVEDGVKHLKFNYGVYIDVFILDVLPKNKIIQECKLAYNYLLYSEIRIKFSASNNFIFKMLGKIINPIKIEQRQKNIWKKSKGNLYKDDDTLYFFNKNKRNRMNKFDKIIFDELVDHKFENLVCKIPKQYEKLLTQCYGDYMEMPPIEQRQTHEFIEFEEI